MKDAAFLSIVPKQEDAKTKIVYMGERLKRNKMGMSIDEPDNVWVRNLNHLKKLDKECQEYKEKGLCEWMDCRECRYRSICDEWSD